MLQNANNVFLTPNKYIYTQARMVFPHICFQLSNVLKNIVYMESNELNNGRGLYVGGPRLEVGLGMLLLQILSNLVQEFEGV